MKDLPGGSTSLHLGIYSSKRAQEFTLSCLELQQQTIEVGEEISLLSNYMSVYYLKPSSDKDPLFIYAIGANTEVFRMSIRITKAQHSNANEEELLIEKMFRNGYGAVFSLAAYPQTDSIQISIESEVNENIKLGVKKMQKQDNTITMLRETFGLLKSDHLLECYTAPSERNVIINIMSYPSPAEILLNKKDGDQKAVIVTSITDSIKINLDPEIEYICINKPKLYSKEFIAYSFQFIEYNQLESSQRFLAPLINGVHSKFILPPGKAISLRKRRVSIASTANPQIHLSAIKGNPILYSARCETYPCEYSKDKIDELLSKELIVKGNAVNKNSCVSYRDKREVDYNYTYDSPNKNLSVVYCADTDVDCEFYLTMFEESDIVELVDNYSFHNPTSQIDNQIVKYSLVDSAVASISFELYCYTGDAQFQVEREDEQPIEQIMSFNGNKKVITILKSESQAITGDYLMVIEPNEPTYYSFSIIFNDKDKTTYITPGEILLQSIAAKEETKKYRIKNAGYPQSPFILSLSSLNCKLKMSIGGEVRTDLFILNPTDPSYIEGYIDISVAFEASLSQISKDDLLCLFYLSGIDAKETSELILSEGISHKMKLIPGQINQFSYLYPISINLKGDRIIVDLSYYTSVSLLVTATFEGNKGVNASQHKMSRGRKLLFESAAIAQSCNFNSMCSLHIAIKSEFALTSELSYTIAVKSLKKVPVYLKSEAYIKDIVAQDTVQYFYTNIGLNEEGEVMVSFNKGTGAIYARIVQIDFKETDADYNFHLILPSKATNEAQLLKYSYAKRRIGFSSKETGQCGKGCALYIGVQYEYDSDFPESLSPLITEFSIIKRGISKDTVTKLNVNEYAYGSIDDLQSYNKYTFASPFDTSELRFHLFSDVAQVTVSLSQPIEKTWHISDPKGIVTIAQSEVGQSSMKDIEFTLMVTVTKIVMKSSNYAIKISASIQKISDLNYLTSEQNEVCIFTKPLSFCNLIRSVNGYEKIDTFFMIITSMNNRHNSFEIYANLISAEKFETDFKEDDLPTPSKSQISSRGNLKPNTLFIDKINEKLTGSYYIIISIRATEIGKGLVLSSAISNMEKITLNHNTKTMIHTKKDGKARFKLSGASNYLVSFAVISGQGELRIENQQSIRLENSIIVEILDISSNDYEFQVQSASDDLMYYVSYIETAPAAAPSAKQLKEIVFGDENKLILSFPVLNSNYYFRVIPTKEKDSIVVIAKFYLYEIKTVEGTEEFVFNAYLTDYDFISSALENPEMKPEEGKLIKGVYDPIGRTGKIVFNQPAATGDLKEYYVLLELAADTKNRNVYSKIEPHITAFPLSSINSIFDLPQMKYYHNAIESDMSISILKLTKYSQADNKMIIEFSSCVGDLIEVSLRKYATITDSEDLELLKNDTTITFEAKKQFNKDVIAINMTDFDSIGLVISRKVPLSTDNSALAYVIKYKTGYNIHSDTPYKQTTSSSITVSNDKKKLNLIVSPIIDSAGKTVKADYVFRIVKGTETQQPTINSICVLKSNQDSLLKRTTISPSDINDKISFSSFGLTIENKLYYYFYAVAIQGNEEEMFAYDSNYGVIVVDTPSTSSGWVTILFIVIGSLVGVGFVGLLVYYCIKRRERQNVNILDGPTEPLYNE